MSGERMLRVLDVLSAEALRQWCERGRQALADECAEIDALNVYPVPDGDTGTNLLLTMEAAETAAREAGGGLAEVAAAVARGALLGARGNSGVILAQLLRGLADVLAENPDGRPDALARGLTRAADLAYAAVAAPVEGTLLSVARAAGRAATATYGADLPAVATAARVGAEHALARTMEELPALRAAGVVDAGGRGWVVLLRALEEVVRGDRPAAPELSSLPPLPVPRPPGAEAVRESGSEAYAYEVQYLLRDTDEPAVAELRRVLGGLGDSLVVIGGEGLYNVHVHVNDVGAAVEAGIEAGRPFRVTVTRFADSAAVPTGRALLATTDGEGLARLLTAAGATVLAGRPSVEALVTAARRTGAAAVTLLPADADLHEVAQAAAERAAAIGVRLLLVPSRNAAEALAALAVRDPAQDAAAEAEAMCRAAASARSGLVPAGPDAEGEAVRLLDRLTPGAELVTLVLGAAASDGLAEQLAARVRTRWPGTGVEVVDGGQPGVVLLLGAE